jgi:outer membrane receptor for ferrienterochelin and colicins
MTGGRSSSLSLALLLTSTLAFAQSPPSTPDEDAELASLLSVLAEETAIATQTKLNADFVPGIVSVLHGDEMEALGARNVGEAIALVPGLQSNRDIYGLPLYFVRGVPFFDSAGGFKILVDGLTLSRENSGVSGSVLTMAIEQVDRIEIIRGPGSGVWGDFAFVGLINIITKRDRNSLWLTGGNRGLRAGGAVVHQETGGFEITATLSGWRTVGGDSPDVPPPPAFRVPDREVESGIATFELRRGNFSFAGSGVKREFGRVNNSARHFPSNETSWAMQARHEWAFGPGRSLAAYAQYLQNDLSIMAISYDAHLWNGGVDAAWKLGRHSFVFRGSHAVNTIDRAIFVPVPLTRPDNVVTDLDQKITSAVLQDSIDLNKRWSLTAGVRYDRQSDIGSTITPRAAAVWRLTDRHVLKAQYAEGFRAPTFQYLYDNGEVLNPAVEFEEVETTDLGYIFRGTNTVARVTVFRSEFSNLRIPPPPYRKGASAEAEGVELEWEQSFSSRLKLFTNVSWVDPVDRRPTPAAAPRAQSVGFAEWVGNAALLARVRANLLLGLHWNHVGERDLGTTTEEGYDHVNLTATWHPRKFGKLSVRGGVRNVLDDRVFAVYSFVGNVQRPAFSGRIWTLQTNWRF